MGFFGAAHGSGGLFGPHSLKSVTYILQWWAQLDVTWQSYTLPKEDPKNI